MCGSNLYECIFKRSNIFLKAIMLSVVVPSIIALTELLINEAQLYPPHPTMKKDAMGRTSGADESIPEK